MLTFGLSMIPDESDKLNLKPEVWITAYPIPYEEKLMKVYRR